MSAPRVRDVLAAIFDGCDGLVEVRAKTAGGARPRFFAPDDVDTLKQIVVQSQDCDTWFGVASRKDSTSGKLENCQHLSTLFTDLDCHGDPVQIAAAEARLKAFPLPPSLVIRSGGGLHVYWFLREPLDVQTEQAQIYAYLRRLQRRLDGDPACAEPARVLRLPATYNHKPEYGSPRRVTVHTFEPSRRYNLGEFDELLPADVPVTATSTPAIDLSRPILEGEGRNAAVYRCGRGVKLKGAPDAEVVAAMHTMNATFCRPSMDAAEMDSIIRNVLTQPNRTEPVPDVDLVHDAVPAATGIRRAVLTPVADIEAREIDWLWKQRKARGLLNLTVGDPGLGKTFLQLDLAARISRGRGWPDGGFAPLGDVILLSAEDHAAFTLRPRLELLDADLTRVHIFSAVRTDGDPTTDALFSLASDLALLEQAIVETDAIAVFIDPINGYFGTKYDAYKDTHIRAVLAPLSALAERLNVCVDGTMHLTKATERRALYRVLGGIGFVASARVSLVVAQHPDDDTARVLLSHKANICAPAETLAFRLTDGGLTWDTEPVIGLTADVVLGASLADQHVRQDVEDWLRQILADGPMPVSVLQAEAKAAGLSWRTLERTKAQMRQTIDTVKLGFNPSAWHWLLTKTATKAAEDLLHGKLAAFDKSGGLREASDRDTAIEDRQTGEDRQLSMQYKNGGLVAAFDAPAEAKVVKVVPPVADEPLPGWVTEDEPPLAANDSDAPFADHDEEDADGGDRL